jgi:hypothetical protein
MWDKEWNKPGTLETKAFPIRDGYHAPLRLCHPLGRILRKKREKCLKDSAINLAFAGAESVMSLARECRPAR